MRITLIGCPFRTSYGAYIQALGDEIGRQTGRRVRWIGANCGCGDPVERNRIFQRSECDYFEVPVVCDSQSKTAWKRWIRNNVRDCMAEWRAHRLSRLQQPASVVHFHQVLNGFGANAAFRWLRRPSGSLRFVTVHEMDGYQLQHRETNYLYNLADGLIVHSSDMRQQLIDLGVAAERVHVMRHGTEIPAAQVSGGGHDLVYYAGHKPMSGKGIETLFAAMVLILGALGPAAPRLKIHGHYGPGAPADAVRLAARLGIDGSVDWLNQISMDAMGLLYGQSMICILPYGGSFAGLPAGVAAAHGLPVIATRRAALPEHLGDNAIWIDEGNPVQLAERVVDLFNDKTVRARMSAKLRRHAVETLSWEVVVKKLLGIYGAACDATAGRGPLQRRC